MIGWYVLPCALETEIIGLLWISWFNQHVVPVLLDSPLSATITVPHVCHSIHVVNHKSSPAGRKGYAVVSIATLLPWDP